LNKKHSDDLQGFFVEVGIYVVFLIMDWWTYAAFRILCCNSFTEWNIHTWYRQEL